MSEEYYKSIMAYYYARGGIRKPLLKYHILALGLITGL
jgi:hypothetical protein